MGMDAKARKALNLIQECVAAKRYVVLTYFAKRMDLRGFFWADVLAVINDPGDVRFDGHDRFDRPKWIVSGETLDGLDVELVCAIDRDERGNVTVFITIY